MGQHRGRFLAVKETISFLGLRATAERITRRTVVDQALLDAQTLYEPGTVNYACAEHFCSYERFCGENDAFNMWVQCRFPALAITWIQREARAFARLVDGASGTLLVIEPHGEQGESMGVAVKGERDLWKDLVRVYEEWLVVERAGREGFALLETEGKQRYA